MGTISKKQQQQKKDFKSINMWHIYEEQQTCLPYLFYFLAMFVCCT